jgi:hypothetical protein
MPDSHQANDATSLMQPQPPPGRPHPPYHRWVDFLPGSKPDSPEDRHDDGSVLKRVSLDATATWCGDDEEDDDDYCYGDNDGRRPPNDGGGGHGNNSSNPLDVEDTMMMLDWTDDDADHMDTGALPGLMMMDDYDQHHEDSHALLNEVFLGEAEVPSSPMRTECCWDHLDAPDDDDDDHIDADNNNNNDDAKSAGSGAHCLEAARFSSSSPSSLSARGVTRTHSSGSSSAGSAASGSDAQLSLQELFEQRRAQLEASMERSRKSRKYLEKHIQQRASLASVLADIERSSRQIIVEVLSTTDAAAAAGRSGDEEDSGSHAGDGEHEEEHGRAAEEDEECSMVTVEV